MLASLDAESVEAFLKRSDLPADVRRVLELRQLTGQSSVKKVHAIENTACADDRIRNMMIHHGTRTGRPTGGGNVQPLNLPKAGPKLAWCVCDRPHRADRASCPWCGGSERKRDDRTGEVLKPSWSPAMVDHVLEIMATQSLDMVEAFFGDAMLAISGCVRGLFVAGPGKELIASDYSAIEAVVAAMLSGEQWRIDVFNRKDDIYLAGASKITGVSLDDYKAHAAAHGGHHPDRAKVGKISELALGYGGYVGSWRAFDPEEASKSDAELKQIILAWRDASPAIVEMWGGQYRGRPWDRDRRPELYGVEGMMIAAVQNPGAVYDLRGLKFEYARSPDRLLITLLSGRQLTYHQPKLTPGGGFKGDELSISYMTWNSNVNYGALGWVSMRTWGSRVFENLCQAVAHDIQRHGIILLRLHGYPLVLAIYDEDVCEVPKGFGSIEEFERLMSTMPPWAAHWPIRAAGGWRGLRFRKG